MSFRPPGRSPKASLVRGARRAGAAVTCLALPRFNWPDRCRAAVFLRVLRDSDSVRSQDRNDLWGVRATARPIRRIAFCVVASNDQFERSNMTARRILIVAFCLIAAGCAALDANESPPRVVPPPPEGKKLVELVKAAFTMAKLSGAPEVSQVRAAHDTQRGLDFLRQNQQPRRLAEICGSGRQRRHIGSEILCVDRWLRQGNISSDRNHRSAQRFGWRPRGSRSSISAPSLERADRSA